MAVSFPFCPPSNPVSLRQTRPLLQCRPLDEVGGRKPDVLVVEYHEEWVRCKTELVGSLRERRENVSGKRKLSSPVREGMPTSCVACSGNLHRKSEHYCSLKCEAEYKEEHATDAPPFLSKWKVRKNKARNDPVVEVRQKARRKTKSLLRAGTLVKGLCVVCGTLDVVAHHEDYDRPGDVIWLCDTHHKEYHAGKIGLFQTKLWWNPIRLIPKSLKGERLSQKYRDIKKEFNRNKPRFGGPCTGTDDV